MNSGNTQVWNSTLNPPLSASAPSASRENVGVPREAALTYTARIPTQTSTLPATRNRNSFIALYSLVLRKDPKSVLLPHTPMSRYIGNTANS